VASLLGTATTCDDSGRSVALGMARHASIASSEVGGPAKLVERGVLRWCLHAARPSTPAARVCRTARRFFFRLAAFLVHLRPPALPSCPPLQISGSVALDGGCAQPLLPSLPGPGLRHFRVPQHLHWPDALAAAALLVYLPPEAEEDLRRAALELLAALPALGVEGVACVTAALPPVLRLAALPPAELAAELDALLHSGRTLLLQAWLLLRRGCLCPAAFAAAGPSRRLPPPPPPPPPPTHPPTK
jgi:hypothetical protein